MRIFHALLIIIIAVILWMLPVTGAIYAFRTDPYTDEKLVTTGVGETSGNLTLSRSLYNNDTSTLRLYSDNSSDTPAFATYNNSTRVVSMSSLTADMTRTISCTYDYDALSASVALNTFLDKLSWVWLICIMAFAPAAIAAIFIGRA